MQTAITAPLRETEQGREADLILRSCVHCGFCTATCPTYELTGDELDGPRGRIYLIKAMLEGHSPTRATQHHLDRCLTCRACETTCPSGVRYARLLEIGRAYTEAHVQRPASVRLRRWLLRALLPHRRRFAALLWLGRRVKPVITPALGRRIPPKRATAPWTRVAHTRKMLLLESCGQADATPNTNAATARVLDRLNIELVRVTKAGCCGAMSHHMSATEEARQFARHNIDAWWPHLESGAEALVVTASGCGTMVREYGELLADDPLYIGKAKRIASLARDLSEVLIREKLPFRAGRPRVRVAFHSPCSLQHGQRVVGTVERLLERAGYTLTQVAEGHLCCGSAGTYSLLQPELSEPLLQRKVAALTGDRPDLIATANVGCQLHLESGTRVPVRHWIELVDEAMS